MHGLYMYLMYGKYLLFHESPKNLRYLVHAQTVSTRPLLGGGGGLGTRLKSRMYVIRGVHYNLRVHVLINSLTTVGYLLEAFIKL